ncbi:MAG: nuclear transport factor 2 family protein [Acidimicrobiales bacterium]
MTTPSEWVEAYLDGADRSGELDRLVTDSSGLDAPGILAVLGDPRLGADVIHAMSDLMHPEESMYYDAIYGAFHGQIGIRNWLVPTMAEIPFIEFVPQKNTEVFSHGGGSSSVDEWQMWMTLEGERVPLPRGVSVRHYADGWITWNADVYDTGAFRRPPDDAADAPPLPPPPDTEWRTVAPEATALSDAAERWLATTASSDSEDGPGLEHADLHAIAHHPELGADTELVAALMHPTESVYLDPLFGDFRGRDEIRAWLGDIMAKTGTLRFDPVGPALFNGSCSVQEWVQMGVDSNGEAMPMVRGTSVRRYADGAITYAADYFDTAALADPAVQRAAYAAGATLTADDIARYRD